MHRHDCMSHLCALPSSQILKSRGCYRGDSACASHHIINPIKGVPYGNQKKWFTTIRQRPRRLVYRHGAHRSTVPGKRSGSRARRERDVRAGCSHRVAHTSARSDPACQVFSLLLFGSSFLVPFIYPNVGKDVLHFTFWGLIIAACVQPAKVLNSILGNGILPSGGDTKYILLSHVIGSYAIGVPAAIFSGFVLHLSVWGVFGSRALEEMLKAIFFLRRYRTPAWYKKSVDELSNQSKKPNAQALSL
jgi:hypothetical protein